MALASGLVWHGRFKKAEGWVQHAERTGRLEADPAANMGIRYVRLLLDLARGRDHEAVAAFRAAERLAGLIPAPHVLLSRTWALQLHALVRLGELERTGRVLAGLKEQDRERGKIRTATAALRLAQDDPRAATAALAPVLEGSTPVPQIERALDLAEPDHVLSRSSSTPRRDCWSAMPGTVPDTRPWSRRSSPCFQTSTRSQDGQRD